MPDIRFAIFFPDIPERYVRPSTAHKKSSTRMVVRKSDKTSKGVVMALKIWELSSIILSALVTGVFWGPWVGLTRSIATFAPEAFLALSI